MARPVLTTGLISGWGRAFGEPGAAILFAGRLRGATQTMPLSVYHFLERDLNAAIITAPLLVALAVLALVTAQ